MLSIQSDSGDPMLRLTALLCAAMYVTMLLGGQDYGQLRPGLLAAKTEAETALAQPVALALADDLTDSIQTPSIRPATPEVEVTAVAYSPVSVLPAPETAPAPQPEPTIAQMQDPAPTVWVISAKSANVRQGPGKSHAVVGRLTRGDEALLVRDEGNGWGQILVEGDGVEGFVSLELMRPAN
jgi:uncharacterized protein YgiM (DUF1202 family)